MNVDDYVFNFSSMEANVSELAVRYASADPFPHIVLDDVLDRDVFKLAGNEFPAVDESFWTNYVHVNSRKYGNTKAETWPPALQEIARALTSDRFVRFLNDLTGHVELAADWSMDGGGLHQSLPGGFLNVHTDFSSHHTHPELRRCVNVLMYFNESWDESWGGDLQLWSPDMKSCERRIAPIGNRMVIFTTNETSFHGHPERLACPADETRRSMALYYFQRDHANGHRSTTYRARPTDGRAEAARIYVDTKLLRAYDVVKRRFDLPDDGASQVLRRVRNVRGRLRRPRSGG